MGSVTDLQKRILEYIARQIRQQGFPPSMREIGRGCGITSPSSVAYHLKRLEAQGLLKRTGTVSRGLRPEGAGPSLPILGRVSAGVGLPAQEDIEGHFSPEKDITRRADYLLRVKGGSMETAGILDGDLVQVRRQQSADDGDLVVAFLREHGEGVVKQLRRIGKYWRLESATPGYDPITKGFDIIGKVVGLVRRY